MVSLGVIIIHKGLGKSLFCTCIWGQINNTVSGLMYPKMDVL